MITLEKPLCSIAIIVLKWKTRDSLTLDQEWKHNQLQISEDFSKRKEKQSQRKFKSSQKNVETMCEMGSIASFTTYDLESLKKFKWMKRRRRTIQIRVKEAIT